jgi:hypothetical protein
MEQQINFFSMSSTLHLLGLHYFFSVKKKIQNDLI